LERSGQRSPVALSATCRRMEAASCSGRDFSASSSAAASTGKTVMDVQQELHPSEQVISAPRADSIPLQRASTLEVRCL